MGSVRPDYDTFGPFRAKVKGLGIVVEGCGSVIAGYGDFLH